MQRAESKESETQTQLMSVMNTQVYGPNQGDFQDCKPNCHCSNCRPDLFIGGPDEGNLLLNTPHNQRLIAYCAAHYVNAYENELGSVTMGNTFFNTPEIEYVNVSTLAEVRVQLEY